MSKLTFTPPNNESWPELKYGSEQDEPTQCYFAEITCPGVTSCSKCPEYPDNKRAAEELNINHKTD